MGRNGASFPTHPYRVSIDRQTSLQLEVLEVKISWSVDRWLEVRDRPNTPHPQKNGRTFPHPAFDVFSYDRFLILAVPFPHIGVEIGVDNKNKE
jgi:hypothetical protein